MTPHLALRHHAFTLLELIVVLAIAAMLASVVMLSLGSHFQQAAVARAIDSLITADRVARRTAVEPTATGVILNYDLPRHRIKLATANASQSSRAFSWPAKVVLTDLQVLENRSWTSSSEPIEFSYSGNSPTYSIRLSSGKVSQWLVIFGLTGQASVYDTPESFAELQRELSL